MALRFLKGLIQSASSTYQKLSLVGKALIWFIVLFYACFVTFIIVITPTRIAQFMYNAAQDIRHLPYGYALFIVVLTVLSFPPFVGYAMILNLFGFTYGIQGFFPAAVGVLAASAIVFVTLRIIFSQRLRSWSSTNEKWQVLETVIVAIKRPALDHPHPRLFVDAVGLVKLAIGTSVSLFQFFIATLFVLPHAMVYVFVGTRIAKLADGEQRNQMDTQTEILNNLLAVGGILGSGLTSSLLYYFIRKEIKRQHASLPERDELAAEALEAAEETPLLRSNSLRSLSLP